MSNPENLAAYTAGVRLSQFKKLITMAPTLPNAEIEAAVHRVRLALNDLDYQLLSLRLLRKYITSRTVKTYVSHWDQQNLRDSAAGIKRHVEELTEKFSLDLGKDNLVANDWLRLGLEIANGFGTIVDHPDWKINGGPPQKSIKTDQRDWEWSNPALLDKLFTKLSLDQDEFFPRDEVLGYNSCPYFSELDFDVFWGWIAIEIKLSGTKALRPLFKWDTSSRSLYYDEGLIHKFQRSAGHQIPIFEEFEKNSWMNPTAGPEILVKVGKLPQTISSLNKYFKNDIGLWLELDGDDMHYKFDKEKLQNRVLSLECRSFFKDLMSHE